MFVGWTVVVVVLLAAGAVIAKLWLQTWFLATVLAVLAASFAIGRRYQYRRAGNPLGIRLRPRVPEARVVQSTPVAAKPREPDPEPGETPRFLG